MTDDERTLLGNVLDALDRLFDRQPSIVSLYAAARDAAGELRLYWADILCAWQCGKAWSKSTG
jgi:hypothetical protein